MTIRKSSIKKKGSTKKKPKKKDGMKGWYEHPLVKCI